MAFSSSKKLKLTLMETESGYKGVASFPKFIIIESTETLITNLLPFLIEKVISSNMTPVNIKKTKKNQTLLVEVDKRKNVDFLLKMTKFHTINVKTYLHKSLKISKGAVRNKKLSLCTIEEINKEMKKQGVTEVKRVTIKKEGKLIETNTYIMTFDQPKIPEKIKVGYTMERVE